MTFAPTCNDNAGLDELIQRHRHGFNLEQAFYTSPDVFELETRAIIRKQWLLAGHVSQISRAGDYFLYEAGGDSIIVIRADEANVNAMLNVCPHRGARICPEPEGSHRKLVCPYHSWVFSTSGDLVGCRDMPEDFDKSRYSLQRAHVRVVEGLIYICLAPQPPDFSPLERDIQTFLRPHRVELARVAHHRRYLVRANWKLVAENFLECYHCGPTHPEYCGVMSWVSKITSGPQSPAANAFNDYVEQWKIAPNRHFPAPVPATAHTTHECARTIIGPGKVSQTQGGKPVSKLMGEFFEYDGASTMVRVMTSWVIIANDYGILVRCTPVDARQTEMDCKWLVHADAVEGSDYNLDDVVWLWKTTYEQDVVLVENNQRGVNSRSYQPGPYSQSESGASLFIDWYLNQMRS